MLPRIKKVEYLEKYCLTLTFNNNVKKIVDLKELSTERKNTIFYPFRDLEFFKKVRVDKHAGTIFWPNGADLCPDVLYEMGKEIKNKRK